MIHFRHGLEMAGYRRWRQLDARKQICGMESNALPIIAEWNACDVCRALHSRRQQPQSCLNTSATFGWTRKCAQRRRIYRGDLDAGIQLGWSSAAAEMNNGHGAGRQFSKWPPGRHDLDRVLQRQNTGQMRGHVLTNAVADHRFGGTPQCNPPVAQARIRCRTMRWLGESVGLDRGILGPSPLNIRSRISKPSVPRAPRKDRSLREKEASGTI